VRLRATLLPIFLLTEKPIFADAVRFFAYTIESRCPPHDLPARYVYRNSFFRRKESVRFTCSHPLLKIQLCGKQMPAASACASVSG
jgi:hypothetical protein